MVTSNHITLTVWRNNRGGLMQLTCVINIATRGQPHHTTFVPLPRLYLDELRLL